MPPLTNLDVMSLIPPALIILIALLTRHIFIALAAGLYSGCLIYLGGNPLTAMEMTLDTLVNILKSPSNTMVIIFSALVGSLIIVTQKSGGVSGFVNRLTKTGIGKTRKSAQMFSFFIGFVVFIESSITSLVAGSATRPLFDRLKISREKLAYILDSTAAPICILIPINAWGGYIASKLNDAGIKDGLSVFIKTIPFNFYPILAVLFCLFIILKKKDFGPMAAAEKRVKDEGLISNKSSIPLISDEITTIEPKQGIKHRAINMILPILVMIVSMPIFLFVVFPETSSSKSVLFAVLLALFTAYIIYRIQNIFKTGEFVQLAIKGAGDLISLSLILMFAFAIGDICKALGTGTYLAQAAKLGFGRELIPAALFIITSLMAFATGTSWGTWGIMIPIALPIISAMDANFTLSLGAVLGGGIFGDHCSPISDTTVVASLASASDHIDHVRTQLPYALTVAGITFTAYAALGFVL